MKLLQYILIVLLLSIIVFLCYLGYEVKKFVKIIPSSKQITENIVKNKDLLKNFIK